MEPGFGSCRPAEPPTPVMIDAVGGSEDLFGTVVIIDARQSVVEMPVSLPAHARKQWRITLPSGAIVARGEWRPDARSVPDPAIVDDPRLVHVNVIPHPPCAGTLIGTIAREAGSAARWPAAVGNTTMVVVSIDAPDLDGPWQAIDAIDTLFADARTLSELDDHRFATLRTWVLAGGLLVVAPGVDPAPLSRSGRLPATVELEKSLAETPWGQGAVVVSPELAPDPAGALAATLRARASVQTASRARARAEFARLRAVFIAGAGAETERAGIPVAALAALTGLLALGHDLLRRRWVSKATALREYALLLALSIVVVSALSFAVARLAFPHSQGPIRLFRSGSAIARQLSPLSLRPGEPVTLAADSIPVASSDVLVTVGPVLEVDALRPADAVALAAWDAGGAIRLSREPDGFSIENGTRDALAAGSLWEGLLRFDVPAIKPGARATFRERGAPRHDAIAASLGAPLRYVAPLADLSGTRVVVQGDGT